MIKLEVPRKKNFNNFKYFTLIRLKTIVISFIQALGIFYLNEAYEKVKILSINI